MKKILLFILMLTMVISLAACGGNSNTESSDTSSKEEMPKDSTVSLPTNNAFVKLTIPEGWQYDEKQSTSSQVYLTKIESTYPKPEIQFNTSSGSAQEEYDEEIDFWKEKRTKLEDKMYGVYNYKRLGFTWDGDTPSVAVFTDWDNHEGESIKINFFCIGPEDPIIQEVLQSASYF